MPNDKDFELDDLEAFSFDDLSLDEAPSGSADGNGDDPFGVWVKSAPEDLDGAVAENPLAEAALTEDDDFLSSQELADLDESFEFITIEEPQAGEAPVEALDEVPAAPEESLDEAVEIPLEEDTPPQFDEVSLDDFVSFDDTVGPDQPSAQASSPLAEAADPEDEAADQFLDIDINIEDDIQDAELEIIEGAAPAASDDLEEVSLDDLVTEEVDLSDFGDFEEVVPAVADPLASEDDLPEVKDLPAMDELPPLEDLPDFDALPPLEEPAAEVSEASSIEGPLDLDDLPPLAAVAVDDVLGEDELDDGMGDLTIDEGYFEEHVLEDSVSLDLEPSDETDLEHIRALEETLTGGLTVEVPAQEPEAEVAEPVFAPEPTPPPAAPAPDLAALILGKLEQELSGIKNEISALKNEMSSLKVAPPAVVAPVVEAPAEPEVEPVVEATAEAWTEPEAEAEAKPEPSTETKHHGFFDDEDDETIALTGDELDNLLQTAEVIVEDETGEALDEDLLNLDAEGNLVGFEEAPAPTLAPAEGHVTDEEFLAGTSLDLNGPDEGIPQSIELEDDLDIDPLPPGVMEPAPLTLEIPGDEELGLELAEAAPLAPDLEADELSVDNLPSLDDWTLPSEEPVLDSGPIAEPVMNSIVEPVAAPATPVAPLGTPPSISAPAGTEGLSPGLKDELRAVLSYMDKLLASLPDDKIQEFADSEHFHVYKRLFEELGLIE